MQQFHYTTEDLIAGLQGAGIQRGDVVLVYASLGRLGYAQRGKTMADACAVVEEALRTVVGETGTLLIPTYTYSIGRREIFDVEASPSTIGEFTEHMRRRPGALRSADPMLAVSGIGPQAAALFANLPRTCFGAGCLYARLEEMSAKICMIGLELHWATYRHYVEAIARVPFRFAKMFDGVIRENGRERRESWIYHAAPRLPQCAPNGAPLAEVARKRELSRSVGVGRAAVTVIGCREYTALGFLEFQRDPWFAAKGPPLSLDQMLALEDARVGATPVRLPLAPTASSAELIAALSSIRRDEVSDGADAAIAAIAQRGAWTGHRFPSGTPYDAGVVPEKWTCLEATLETTEGATVFSAATNPFHAVSGSFAFDGVIDREQLRDHLRTDPRAPHTVPHVMSRSPQHDWELACSHAQKEALADKAYRVRIRTASSFGALATAEILLGDAHRPAIVLAAPICPGDDGDELGGLGILLEVVRLAADHPPRKYAIRALAVPGESGLRAWLGAAQARPLNLRGALWLGQPLSSGIELPVRALPPPLSGDWRKDVSPPGIERNARLVLGMIESLDAP